MDLTYRELKEWLAKFDDIQLCQHFFESDYYEPSVRACLMVWYRLTYTQQTWLRDNYNGRFSGEPLERMTFGMEQEEYACYVLDFFNDLKEENND